MSANETEADAVPSSVPAEAEPSAKHAAEAAIPEAGLEESSITNGAGPSRIPPGPPPGGPSSAPAGFPPTAPSGGPPGPPPGAPPVGPHGVHSGNPMRVMPMQAPTYPMMNPPVRMQGYPSFPPPAMGMGMGMPPPTLMPNFPPPLPPGWSEHIAPDGVTRYYFNSQTKESTYVRPSFAPLPPPIHMTGSASPVPPVEKKKKKEKPKDKIPVPGTTWTRITTTEGNVFYFEKESKRSEWSVPEEIKEEVEQLEKEEREAREEEKRLKEEKAKEERLERLREQERVKAEIEEERRMRAEKRKAAETNGEATAGKKQKMGSEDGYGEAGSDDGDAGDGQFGPQNEEDEEEWMKAVAAEFAQADQIESEENTKTREQIAKEEQEAAKKVFAVPEKVNVTLEEQRALFKALLIEKNISPFAPWDTSLPLFINDPRYVLLSSQKDRREVYEEYCRDEGRQRRLKKAAPASAATESAQKKADPEKEYKALLREDVTSTRTRWDVWRKKWKKDRKFYAYGRDDREREKMFKQHLKELGERRLLVRRSVELSAHLVGKRADAQRAEADFFELLSEQSDISSSSVWSEVKQPLSSDARYDAVGSSTLREELFQSYIRKLASSSTTETPEQAAERKLQEKKAKQEASLRERQQRVGQEKEKVEKDVGRSKAGAGREEGERLFGSLLVDQVRDHETSWNEAARFLEPDPRFNHPALRLGDKRRLFEAHAARIAGKRSNALFSLFQANTPGLDTPYDQVYPKIIEDPIVQRLELDVNSLEGRWNAWRRTRETEARAEFEVMLGENSFVEFWGKMRKKTLDEAALAVKEDEMDDGEGMGEGGAADLTQLAKQIDLEEIKAVLRRDKRYRQFDHMPDQREQWLRDYLESQEAASGSKTIHTVGQTR